MKFSSHVIKTLDMVDQLIVDYGSKRICLDQFLNEMEKKCVRITTIETIAFHCRDKYSPFSSASLVCLFLNF